MISAKFFTNKTTLNNKDKIFLTPISSNSSDKELPLELFQDLKLEQSAKEVTTETRAKKYFKSLQELTTGQLIKNKIKLNLDFTPDFSVIKLKDQKIILRLMKELILKVDESHTAGKINATFNGEGLNLQEGEFTKQEQIFYENVVEDKNLQSKDNLMLMLKLTLSKKNLLCNDMALIMAILLRNNEQLSPDLKDGIVICNMGGHTVCCIGNHKAFDSLIIDPWVSYLDLPAKKNYRDELTSWNNSKRESGFLGSRRDYKLFLNDHPNEYTNDGPFKLVKHTNFTVNSIGIKLEEINTPLTQSESDVINMFQGT